MKVHVHTPNFSIKQGEDTNISLYTRILFGIMSSLTTRFPCTVFPRAKQGSRILLAVVTQMSYGVPNTMQEICLGKRNGLTYYLACVSG